MILIKKFKLEKRALIRTLVFFPQLRGVIIKKATNVGKK